MTGDPTTAPAVTSTITDNAAHLLPVLLTIGGLALVVAVGVFGLRSAWRLFTYTARHGGGTGPHHGNDAERFNELGPRG